MNRNAMKNTNITKLVITMAMPMILSMCVNSLYNIIDSYFVAKISENAMTALSVVYPLQNLVVACAVGFGIGINAMIAYYLGAKKQDCADSAAVQGLVLGVVHGIVLTVGCILAMPWFVRLFSRDAEMISMALSYSNIAFLFCTVNVTAITMEKIFQSVGMMKVSMISMTAGCIANILLDPIMIFGFGPVPAMGIQGAALATGIGQTLTMILYIVFFKTKDLPIAFRKKGLKENTFIIRRMYGIGIPAGLTLALPSLLITVLNGILAEFSDKYVLILGIYYKLQTFIYLTVGGLVQGVRPVISFNYGAKAYDRVHAIIRTSIRMSLLFMAIGTAVAWLMPQTLIGLFTTSEATIEMGSTALRIISIGFVVSAISVIVSGSLEALGEGTKSLVISLIRYTVVMIPVAWILSRFLGATGVWHAFWVTESIAGLYALYLLKKDIYGKTE